jgi:hypothetical protein
VECAFGILSIKWRIFQRPLNVNPDFAVDIVKACVSLHNFVPKREALKFEDAMTVAGLEDVPYGQSVHRGLTANNLRSKVDEYFLTDAAAVPWQM